MVYRPGVMEKPAVTLPENPSLAIVGATGAVGREMLSILAERDFPHASITALASERSAGKQIQYRDETLQIQTLTESSFGGIDAALFSAGGSISTRFAPIAVESGAVVIDNSSAFRMDADTPLVIADVNDHVLEGFQPPGIIANPNCTAIVALMAVTPLHRAVGIERMVISTYQSASGAGAALMNELEQQAHDHAAGRPYRTDVLDRPYLFNLFSHNTPIGPDGYNEEERKVIQETHKIWEDDSPRITVTCIRVPVLRTHCESINLTFKGELTEDDAREILAQAPGVKLADDRESNRFPEPLLASGKDDVYVGRIRADVSQPAGKGLEMFIAGDQLRKGAALNAIQIAELLLPANRPANV